MESRRTSKYRPGPTGFFRCVKLAATREEIIFLTSTFHVSMESSFATKFKVVLLTQNPLFQTFIPTLFPHLRMRKLTALRFWKDSIKTFAPAPRPGANRAAGPGKDKNESASAFSNDLCRDALLEQTAFIVHIEVNIEVRDVVRLMPEGETSRREPSTERLLRRRQ